MDKILVIGTSGMICMGASGEPCYCIEGSSDCSGCSFSSPLDLPIRVQFSDGCSGGCGISTYTGDESFTLTHGGGNFWSGTSPSFDVYAELNCVSNIWRLQLFIGSECVDQNWCESGFFQGTEIALNCGGDNYPTGTVSVPMRQQSESPACGTVCGDATVTFG